MTDHDPDLPSESTEVPDRPSLLRAAAWGGAGGSVVLVLLFVWLATRTPAEIGHVAGAASGTDLPRSTEARPREIASVERQTAIRRLSGWVDNPPMTLDQAQDRFQPALVMAPPYDAIDAVMFDTLDTRIRLVGLMTVMRDEICFDADRHRFACGLQARASLQNFLRGKTVVCRPMFGSTDPTGKIVDAHCTADGQPLATYQVAAGFAFPASSDQPSLMATMETARANRLGVWKGDYQIPPFDRSDVDAKATAFGATRVTASGGGGTPAPPEPVPVKAP